VQNIQPAGVPSRLGLPRMSGYAASRRLRHQPGQESVQLAALAGRSLGSGVRTWRPKQQEVKQKQDGRRSRRGGAGPSAGVQVCRVQPVRGTWHATCSFKRKT